MIKHCLCRLSPALAAVLVAACAAAAPPAYTARILATPNDFVQVRGAGFCGGFVGSGNGPATSGNTHALYWADAASAATDLTPAGFTSSDVVAASGPQQVGWGAGPTTAGTEHALLWNGTAESFVDLNAAAYKSSRALGGDGSRQVGQGIPAGDSNRIHALLWSGAAESVVDLHPPEAVESVAHDVRANQQVGSVSFTSPMSGDDPVPQAALWNDAANSVVYLHPIGFKSSVALAVGADSVVGYGDGVGVRALLWRGTGDNALNDIVDLHPTGYYESYAVDVDGDTQIGYGILNPADGLPHALRWTGSRESVVDLHQYLVGLSVDMLSSEAAAILPDGTIIGSATSTDLRSYAVVWTPVPEPASLGLFAAAIGMATLWRRPRAR